MPDDRGMPDPVTDANATYWGRYKGRWRQCFVVLFVIGFVVICAERLDEVHSATHAIALVLRAVVGGIGDGLLLGSVICLLVAIPHGREHVL
jgi:predicted histidine transporter YuiF (NhaC family)